MSVRQRIALALSANAVSQAITILSQVFLIPLFFTAWGAPQYGEWLMLATIPAYLALADFGLGSAAANEMSIHAAAQDHGAAQRTFRGVSRISSLVAAALIGLTAIAVLVAYSVGGFTLQTISSTDAASILLLFSFNVGLSFRLAIISAGFRCCNRNATGIYIGNAFRLLEAVTTGALLLVGASPLAVCASSLLLKLVNLGLTHTWLQQICPWLFYPRQEPDLSLVKRLLKPSIAFLAFPLGNALALQAPILLIGLFFGSGTVAVFSALRTLARIPFQLTFALNSSVSPEMTFAFGAQNFTLLQSLHRKTWALNAAGVGLMAIGIGLFGETILQVWLRKTVAFDPVMLGWLLASSVFLALWSASSIVLQAGNRHSRIAVFYLLANGIGCGAAFGVAALTNVYGLLVTLTAVEVAMTVMTLPLALQASHDKLSRFFKGIFGYRTMGRLP